MTKINHVKGSFTRVPAAYANDTRVPVRGYIVGALGLHRINGRWECIHLATGLLAVPDRFFRHPHPLRPWLSEQGYMPRTLTDWLELAGRLDYLRCWDFNSVADVDNAILSQISKRCRAEIAEWQADKAAVLAGSEAPGALGTKRKTDDDETMAGAQSRM